MSWDFRLKSPVTGETFIVEPHFVYEGNALIPLYQLRTLSKMRPDGVWEVM